MTFITITPKNKKELMALKHFIVENNLSYTENNINQFEKENKSNNLTKEDFEKKLKNSCTIEEFSQKTTTFLESLSWKK